LSLDTLLYTEWTTDEIGIRTPKISKSQSSIPVTVELKSIACKVLRELEVENPVEAVGTDAAHTFNAKVEKIKKIKARQTNDYLKVCVIRLQGSNVAPDTSIQKRAEDQLCILKALLSS
jgi:hypothetical protein